LIITGDMNEPSTTPTAPERPAMLGAVKARRLTQKMDGAIGTSANAMLQLLSLIHPRCCQRVC